jgi:hypothetical protein
MKRFTLVGLSILCLSLAATKSVKAVTHIERLSMPIETLLVTKIDNVQITPFELVSRAYQGEYRTQGIPGFGSFQSAISSKRITAKDLVEAAIDAKQLLPGDQTDRGYLNAIEQQLSVAQN